MQLVRRLLGRADADADTPAAKQKQERNGQGLVVAPSLRFAVGPAPFTLDDFERLAAMTAETPTGLGPSLVLPGLYLSGHPSRYTGRAAMSSSTAPGAVSAAVQARTGARLIVNCAADKSAVLVERGHVVRGERSGSSEEQSAGDATATTPSADTAIVAEAGIAINDVADALSLCTDGRATADSEDSGDTLPPSDNAASVPFAITHMQLPMEDDRRYPIRQHLVDTTAALGTCLVGLWTEALGRGDGTGDAAAAEEKQRRVALFEALRGCKAIPQHAVPVDDPALPVPVVGGAFVHCMVGVSRSATVLLAFLLWAFDGLTLDRAFDYLRTRRPVVSPNEGFMSTLREVERRM